MTKLNILINCYKAGKLTSEEMAELREVMNVTTDEELEAKLRESWMDENFPLKEMSEDEYVKILNNLTSKMGPVDNTPKSVCSNRRYFVFRRWIQAAAACMLILIGIGGTLLFQNMQQAHMLMSMVQTENGQSNLLLPDGTVIALNTNSTIKYAAKSFSEGKQIIEFEGEGYFEVAKDSEHPFYIKLGDVNVQVLGTTFNLMAYRESETIELSLEEGKVQLQTSESTVSVYPGQKAILNKINGKITVTDVENITDDSDWNRGELALREVPLSIVIAKLSEMHGVKINTSSIESDTRHFTGILPTDNLDEALTIIEKAYDIKISRPSAQYDK